MVVVYINSHQLIVAVAFVHKNTYPCAYLSCSDAAESWTRTPIVLGATQTQGRIAVSTSEEMILLSHAENA